jgi:eukaryotic-like serine/threonine-protein kinase
MIGTLLNKRYRVEAQLGQGGMGIVYRARDTLLDRDVAVKLLSEDSRLGSQGRARLLREAQAAAQLNHPNVVSIYDAGQANGRPYIVMELVDGESLYDRKLTHLAEILKVMAQVASALDHAHSHQIIHRDLKPENIIVHNLQAKLTDFGLARSATSRLTGENVITGTVLYLAPEAALGQGVDARSDLYSFGVILYELVTGQLPFTAEDPLGVISQHLYSPVPSPHAHRPDIPQPLEDLILRLLEKQPEARPASAREVQVALEALLLAPAAVPVYPAEADPALMLDRLVRGRLVGRERELAEMKIIMHQALAGQSSVLLVSGEAGIGKTRLARELLAHAAITGARILSGACYAEGGMPYAPFPQLITDSFRLPGVSLPLPEFVLADLVAIAPELRLHLPEPNGSGGSESRSEQQRIFESVVAWAAALSAQAPLVLFIDDIHWADSSTLFLIRHLARRLQAQRVLALLTYREVELRDVTPLQTVLFDLNRERLSSRQKLTRFDRAQTQAMLATMLQPTGQIDASLVDAIHTETEGNPFFIEEVTKALLEEGKLCFNDVCWEGQKNTEIEIPQSVRLTIQNRLSRLPDPTQDVLRLASTIGRRFEFEILSRASDLDEDTLIEALETAERAQILSEISTGRGAAPVFSFAHALIPTTLRESVSSLRRQRLHRRVAQAIEAAFPGHESRLETLAYHYEQAGDAERAEEYYARAADHALEVYANQEAARYYRMALELEPDGPRRAHLLKNLGEACFRQNLHKDARRHWQEASELYRQDGAHGDMAYLSARMARAAWYDADAPGGLRLCLEGLAAVEAMGLPAAESETPGLAALLHETARAYRFASQPEKALPLCQRALDLAERFGLVEVQAESLATMGILFDQPLEFRISSLEKAVELAESAGLLFTAARANVNLASMRRDMLRFPDARRHMQRAAELAQCLGSATWQHSYLHNVTEICLDMADMAGAQTAMAEMERLLPDLPMPADAAHRMCYLQAKVLRMRGELEQASALLQGDCNQAAENEEDPAFRAAINILGGEILLEQGRFAAAEQLLEESIRLLKDQPPEARFSLLPMLAVAAAGQGRLEDAHRRMDAARQTPERQFTPIEAYTLAYFNAHVLLLEGRAAEAASEFEQVAAGSRQAGLVWFALMCRRRQAEALLLLPEAGTRRDALQILEQVRDEYLAYELTAYAAQIAAILANTDIMDP